MFCQNIRGDKHAIHQSAFCDHTLPLAKQAWQSVGVTDFDFSAAIGNGKNRVQSADGDAAFLDKSTKPDGLSRCCAVDLGRGIEKHNIVTQRAKHQHQRDAEQARDCNDGKASPLLGCHWPGGSLLDNHSIGGPKPATWQVRRANCAGVFYREPDLISRGGRVGACAIRPNGHHLADKGVIIHAQNSCTKFMRKIYVQSQCNVINPRSMEGRGGSRCPLFGKRQEW